MEAKDPACSIWSIHLEVSKHNYIYTKTIVPSLHEQSEGFSDDALTIYYAMDDSALLSVSVRENIRGVSSTTQ